ncbi:MAG: hypothetical protein JNK95_00175 [Candidatus Competibacter sp.]|nr:hypothetical protein [Candidatus Competibacter sp.]
MPFDFAGRPDAGGTTGDLSADRAGAVGILYLVRLPELYARFRPLDSTVSRAYGEFWRYFYFIGAPV